MVTRRPNYLVVFILSLLGAFVFVSQTGATAASPFFSVPVPTSPKSFLPYHKGGGVNCGGQSSTVRVVVDSMYTSAGGSEFFCDSSTLLPALPKNWTAWEKRGYLVGVYPFPSPLSKPISITFEIDAARVNKVCSSCWSVQYYNPKTKTWQVLPTTFSSGRRLVSAGFNKSLPQSGVKKFEDRYLVMLFTRSATPSPTPTRTRK